MDEQQNRTPDADLRSAQEQHVEALDQRPQTPQQRSSVEGQRSSAEAQRPQVQAQRPQAQTQRSQAQGQRPQTQGKRPQSEGQRSQTKQRPSGQKKRPANASRTGKSTGSGAKKSAKRSGSPLGKPIRVSDHGTSKSLFGVGGFGGSNMSRVTLIAGIAALLVAAIAWWATGGFGLSEAPENPPETVATSSEQTEPVVDTIEQKVEDALAKLTLEQKIAQMFIVTPEGLTGADVVSSAGDVTRLAMHDRPVGGLIYFDQNLESPQQTREMVATTQQFSKDACGLPLFICVDEEGGEVARIANNAAYEIENTGDAAAIGASGDTAQATKAASTIADYLTGLGFNVVFAPVADIASSEDSVMLSRSFGSTAEAVSPFVQAEVEAFNSAGILSAAKHFPGIGGAVGDPHYAAISTDRTLGEMQNEEFKPFQAAIAANVPMIMMGHISATEATGSSEPASLSKEMITDILRGQLGYDGIVITDSMAMGAIIDSYENSEVGVKAIQAGVDIILMPSNFEATYRGVVDAVSSGQISEERINESVRRILKAKLTMKDTTPKATEETKKDEQAASSSNSEQNADAAVTDATDATDTTGDTEVTDEVAGSDAGDVAETTDYYDETVYDADADYYDESYDASYDEGYDESYDDTSYEEEYYYEEEV